MGIFMRVMSSVLFGAIFFVMGMFVSWKAFVVPQVMDLRAAIVPQQDPVAAKAACSPEFVDAWKTIRREHVGSAVSDDQLKHGAIKGLVAALDDPHSSFLDPKEAKERDQEMRGSFFGIGMIVKIKDGKTTANKIIPGSPAEKAGIRAGDTIVAVDGQPTADEPLSVTVPRIRGVKGTDVVLTIARDGLDAPLDVKVTRGEIKTESVTREIISSGDKSFMKITVSEFRLDTYERFVDAAGQAVGEGVDGVIIDLRDNPGGLLNAAVAMGCTWASGPMVYMTQRGQERRPMGCRGSELFSDMPTVVLVNDHSASASEVLTGALQDYRKAYVIGEKTFGKGCGQTPRPYRDGSQLWLVTFLWETPKGRSINKTGLMPDEVLKADPKDIEKGMDLQMERALQYLSTPR